MTKRDRCKLIRAALRKAMLDEPNGLADWRPRQRVVQNKKRAQARQACRKKVDY